MILVWKIEINKVIVHRVGNKSLDEGIALSNEVVDIDQQPDLNRIFTNFFFKPLDKALFYSFFHTVSLEHNDLYKIADRVFSDNETFISASKDICKLLYDHSDHPNIKSGELYVCYFKDCVYNDQTVDAIGIFKSENKETFLRLQDNKRGIGVSYFEDGINTNKLDKACIILNLDREDGYTVAVYDNLNSKNEAQYWKDKFLKIMAKADEYHHTTDYLTATKEFIVKQIPQEYEVTKAQQADYLNKSIAFFKNNAEFDEKAFVSEVFEDKDLINSFTGYKKEYEQEREIELSSDFYISGTAVKKSARVFKSVIKLDKNFHVYVHGDRDLIEKGYDEAVGKHYYKIYFDEET